MIWFEQSLDEKSTLAKGENNTHTVKPIEYEYFVDFQVQCKLTGHLHHFELMF
jgi:hypothetical protein